jgi:hypothetical protein
MLPEKDEHRSGFKHKSGLWLIVVKTETRVCSQWSPCGILMGDVTLKEIVLECADFPCQLSFYYHYYHPPPSPPPKKKKKKYGARKRLTL